MHSGRSKMKVESCCHRALVWCVHRHTDRQTDTHAHTHTHTHTHTHAPTPTPTPTSLSLSLSLSLSIYPSIYLCLSLLLTFPSSTLHYHSHPPRCPQATRWVRIPDLCREHAEARAAAAAAAEGAASPDGAATSDASPTKKPSNSGASSGGVGGDGGGEAPIIVMPQRQTLVDSQRFVSDAEKQYVLFFALPSGPSERSVVVK